MVTNDGLQRDAFHSIADPTRRRIIALLADSPRNLTDLSEQFDISRPAISKQVRVLEECGVVEIQRSGRERICSVRFDRLQEVSDWIALYADIWNARLNSVDEYLKQLTGKGKTNEE